MQLIHEVILHKITQGRESINSNGGNLSPGEIGPWKRVIFSAAGFSPHDRWSAASDTSGLLFPPPAWQLAGQECF